MSKEDVKEEKKIEQALRDTYTGLLNTINYVYDDFGLINWRETLPKKFLFPNKFHFESQGKEVPTSIEGLEDNQLFISLGGIKWLARVRGYSDVRFDIVENKDYPVMSCNINWLPNYENKFGASYMEIAACGPKNASNEHLRYAESIAANRAFVRCVRNFLNINIVGEEELSTGNSETSNNQSSNNDSVKITPQSIFLKTSKELGLEFSDIIKICVSEGVFNEEAGKLIKNEAELLSHIDVKNSKKLIKAVKKLPLKK